MKRQHIAGIYAAPEAFGGQTLTVCGWARTIRDMKNFGFIELNDGSCFKSLQVVLARGKLDNYDDIARQNVGAAFIVHGELVLTPDAKQPFELKADSITLEGASAPDYPLQKKRHSVEFLRTIQHLRPRTNLFSATFRVRSVAAQAVHTFFQERGFVYVQTPIITGSDCEGAGEMFRVTTLDLDNLPRTDDGKVDFSKDFFGKSTNLTVSGQLNAENFALAFGDVYTFGPTFRAENSNTQRHAAEFWMIEPEMAFADLDDDLECMEAMVKFIINTVLEKCPQELEFFNSFVDKGLLERLHNVVDNDFGRTARQRKLMELLLEKVLDGGMSMTELNNLLNACMPYVQTNMKASTLFDLALGVLRSGISDRLTRGESLLEQHHVPMDGTYSYLDVDGASVINMGSKSFPKNVRALHEFIYGEYIPAD